MKFLIAIFLVSTLAVFGAPVSQAQQGPCNPTFDNCN